MTEAKQELSVDDVIGSYIKIRDCIDAASKQHDEAMKPLKERLVVIENWLAARGNAEAPGDQKWSVSTGSGVAFREKTRYANVKDWTLFWKWLGENPDHAGMVRKGVASTKVYEFVDATTQAGKTEIPPGIEVGSKYEIRVHRKK